MWKKWKLITENEICLRDPQYWIVVVVPFDLTKGVWKEHIAFILTHGHQ